jgi:hypothetical protein
MHKQENIMHDQEAQQIHNSAAIYSPGGSSSEASRVGAHDTFFLSKARRCRFLKSHLGRVGDHTEKTCRTVPVVFSNADGNGRRAELSNLPVEGNVISVRHEGNRSTSLTNHGMSALNCKAAFTGSFEILLVDGKPSKAHADPKHFGGSVTWIV